MLKVAVSSKTLRWFLKVLHYILASSTAGIVHIRVLFLALSYIKFTLLILHATFLVCNYSYVLPNNSVGFRFIHHFVLSMSSGSSPFSSPRNKSIVLVPWFSHDVRASSLIRHFIEIVQRALHKKKVLPAVNSEWAFAFLAQILKITSEINIGL